ncbi:uncharacterized protein SPPG_07774 [Spizellomyces punctatus DAOM BR117]|uniref:Uncharacterized protein n=1 Tax=Spizellomyces punctatus (strain DAOM BR117) TaxID=645134 RepID=A0A0L0H7K9_SPIPD|nr:uncharacterized protein SPPG_07774 [Spizellomyces punctatus DAOM BR117]KNC96954.1 hypothetical protein SPPG_07774 [Spizellomyces punctatus DAOM BR117]|eukprot:XP_016604994.1 hypothetical protein SPPG_07774 [Spizellomyces punctatus DAOM BR117]
MPHNRQQVHPRTSRSSHGSKSGHSARTAGVKRPRSIITTKRKTTAKGKEPASESVYPISLASPASSILQSPQTYNEPTCHGLWSFPTEIPNTSVPARITNTSTEIPTAVNHIPQGEPRALEPVNFESCQPTPPQTPTIYDERLLRGLWYGDLDRHAALNASLPAQQTALLWIRQVLDQNPGLETDYEFLSNQVDPSFVNDPVALSRVDQLLRSTLQSYPGSKSGIRIPYFANGQAAKSLQIQQYQDRLVSAPSPQDGESETGRPETFISGPYPHYPVIPPLSSFMPSSNVNAIPAFYSGDPNVLADTPAYFPPSRYSFTDPALYSLPTNLEPPADVGMYGTRDVLEIYHPAAWSTNDMFYAEVDNMRFPRHGHVNGRFATQFEVPVVAFTDIERVEAEHIMGSTGGLYG